MRRTTILGLMLLLTSCSATRTVVQKKDLSPLRMPQYTAQELKDNIKTVNGVTLTVPRGCVYTMTEEWLNFTSTFGGGLQSYNPFNGMIKGKNVVALIRPYDPEGHSISFDALLTTDYQPRMSNPVNPYPEDFVLDEHLVTIQSEVAKSKFGADKVQYIQVPADKMRFCDMNFVELAEMQKLRAEEYTNTRLYYFFKEGYKRFDILAMYRDKVAAENAAGLEAFLSRLVSY